MKLCLTLCLPLWEVRWEASAGMGCPSVWPTISMTLSLSVSHVFVFFSHLCAPLPGHGWLPIPCPHIWDESITASLVLSGWSYSDVPGFWVLLLFQSFGCTLKGEADPVALQPYVSPPRRALLLSCGFSDHVHTNLCQTFMPIIVLVTLDSSRVP